MHKYSALTPEEAISVLYARKIISDQNLKSKLISVAFMSSNLEAKTFSQLKELVLPVISYFCEHLEAEKIGDKVSAISALLRMPPEFI
jgi:hypothetical protein